MEWARSAFEAVIGPLVVAAIITSVGLGVSAWTSITGLEFELARHTDRYAVLLDQHERLANDYREFKSRGGRYSAADGDRDRSESNARDDKLGARLDVLDQRCRECRVTVERLDERIKRIEQDQQRQHP